MSNKTFYKRPVYSAARVRLNPTRTQKFFLNQKRDTNPKYSNPNPTRTRAEIKLIYILINYGNVGHNYISYIDFIYFCIKINTFIYIKCVVFAFLRYSGLCFEKYFQLESVRNNHNLPEIDLKPK